MRSGAGLDPRSSFVAPRGPSALIWTVLAAGEAPSGQGPEHVQGRAEERCQEHLGCQRHRVRARSQGIHKRGQGHLLPGQGRHGRLSGRVAQHCPHLCRAEAVRGCYSDGELHLALQSLQPSWLEITCHCCGSHM